jgi:hypothetical protein
MSTLRSNILEHGRCVHSPHQSSVAAATQGARLLSASLMIVARLIATLHLQACARAASQWVGVSRCLFN